MVLSDEYETDKTCLDLATLVGRRYVSKLPFVPSTYFSGCLTDSFEADVWRRVQKSCPISSYRVSFLPKSGGLKKDASESAGDFGLFAQL
jgi:hypothetical protein